MLLTIVSLVSLAAIAAADCIPSGPASTVNSALQAGGAGAVVQLCPGAVINITDAEITFTAENQELSTEGYPEDSTRATVIIEPGSNITSAIWGRWTSGVKVLNLQVDGNRPNAGLLSGDALVEMGGGASGQVVSYNVIKNTRSWSCLHYIGSGQDYNPCRDGTVTNNTIGPCGNEGSDDAGNSLWADGVSFECTASEVSYNDISGTTDGGIVVFGAPGSHFIGNSITSTETDEGFGGFNLVDPSYSGNYSGVVISGNTIKGVGTGFFNLGIGIGSHVWSNPNDDTYFGPVTVTDNTFIGNIGFSIVVNHWSGGLTATGNDISQITKPSSSFADASNCQAQVKASFNASEQLIAYLPSITGSLDLQSDFTDVPDNSTIWMCLQHPLPSSLSFAAGALSVTAAQSTVAELEDFHVQLQGDGNLVGYAIDPVTSAWTPAWASNPQTSDCGSDNSLCVVTFGADGDLVEDDGAGQLWDTGTAGEGQTVVFSNASPYLEILDADGASVWTISDGVVQ
ncbi:hypothetical protein VPNG_08944 [Cytospora leucostoma]|uniref:Bulb-type lectin domain-containing protein n=1 Tax=Cytospora leucostoma TaxID=1230097 RepID=A0A423VWC3_9PEZI|nr:hypothetical protein VPNG_08944 [Cytospora leucostoma]